MKTKFSALASEHVSNNMIHTILIRLVLLCVLFIPLAHPQMAWAKDNHIAIVDLEKVSSQSKAGQSIQRQLKERRAAFQKEFSSREDSLAKSEKLLIEEKNTLSVEDFANKRKAFETQLLETRNLFQKRRSSLDKGVSNALATLRKSIVETTAEIADKQNFTIVLSRESVVIAQTDMDITDTVLAALNKKLSNIKLIIED